jgi:hypothetical protein
MTADFAIGSLINISLPDHKQKPKTILSWQKKPIKRWAADHAMFLTLIFFGMASWRGTSLYVSSNLSLFLSHIFNIFYRLY